MRLWLKRNQLAVILITWVSLGAINACAGKPVTWWFMDSKGSQELIRKHSNAPTEQLSYVNADGYLCLSPSDAQYADYAIRQLNNTSSK